jgi:hypothetical protein
VSINPAYGFYQVLEEEEPRIKGFVYPEEEEGNSDLPSLNFRIGVHYNQRLSSNWYLRTGIRWADLGYKIQPWSSNLLIVESDRAGLSWVEIGVPYPVADELEFHYQFLELPLLIKRQFGEKKLGFFIEAGGAFQYQVGMVPVSIFGEERVRGEVQDYSFYRDFHGMLQAGFGLQYRPSGRWHYFLQTNGQYQIPGVYLDTPIQYRLWQVGVECGVRYLLGFN